MLKRIKWNDLADDGGADSAGDEADAEEEEEEDDDEEERDKAPASAPAAASTATIARTHSPAQSDGGSGHKGPNSCVLVWEVRKIDGWKKN